MHVDIVLIGAIKRLLCQIIGYHSSKELFEVLLHTKTL